MRILHCPHNITGNPAYLARAERELGLDSWCVTFTRHPFGYPADETLMQPGQSKFALERHRWSLLWRAVRDFDVIHFNFGSTIMPMPRDHVPPRYPLPIRVAYNTYARLLHLRDLPLLKRMGKGIAMSYHGDDIKQGDRTRELWDIHFADDVEPGYYTPESDVQKRMDLAYIARFADKIYALTPEQLDFLPAHAEFLPTASTDLRQWQVVERVKSPDAPLTLLHAPSNRGMKGTKYIIAAVEKLQGESVPVELLLVEKMSHDEARQAYARADLLIDQVLAGWHGVLSVELMALGKPVIAYLRETDLHYLPAEMRAELPIINATPASLYDVLKLWVTERRAELPEVGRRGRAYVERWHDPLKIAARLKADYAAMLTPKSR